MPMMSKGMTEWYQSYPLCRQDGG